MLTILVHYWLAILVTPGAIAMPILAAHPGFEG